MGPGVRIGRALAREAGALAALHAACFPSGWADGDLVAYADDPAMEMLAAWRDERPLGLIVCRTAADEADLLTLATDPGARRQGIARALLGEALRRLAARGVGRLVLEVSVANAAARALYKNFGFAEVGSRANYYADGGHHAQVLALRLDRRRASVDAP